MPTTHYTSDLHLGHGAVADKRGFTSTREHDELIRLSWIASVQPDDTVYVLGDVAVSGFDYALGVLADLPGRKHLIAGNHDPVHPMHRRTFAAKMPRWEEVFETVSPFVRRRVAGHEVLLSHFPYASWGDGAREGSRFNQYRLVDAGVPLMHGHTHGIERAHGHSLHIGLDAWGMAPVRQDSVIYWLDELSAYHTRAELSGTPVSYPWDDTPAIRRIREAREAMA
jgi:calcineurin-like phosphoesterase family protein